MSVLRISSIAPLLPLALSLAAAPAPTAVFSKYCMQCHGKGAAGGINLEQLATGDVGENFQKWEKVAAAVAEKRMPPAAMPQPADAERAQIQGWVKESLDGFIAKNAGDPGKTTVRRLTSGEYGYAIEDLTGLKLEFDRDFVADSVGGEGFTNFGEVQFLGDANLERYLAAAKQVAKHAVVGSGPLTFYIDPGKTGLELSALDRIRRIYTEHGFRATGAEGARAYGLEKYSKAFYAAWRFHHRQALGEPKATLASLAKREGLMPPFVEHIWAVVQEKSPVYPTSIVVERWRKLPAPGAEGAAEEVKVRAECEAIQKELINWPRMLFAAGALAAGGQGDERNLVISEATLPGELKHRFRYPLRSRQVRKSGTVHVTALSLNPDSKDKPLLLWKNAKVRYRKADRSAGIEKPLYEAIDEASRAKLTPTPDGSGFTMPGDAAIPLHIPFPEGIAGAEVSMEVELVNQGAGDAVVRCTVSDQPDVSTGRPMWALLADPQSPGFTAWRNGVLAFAAKLPQNSQGEATPADRDPIPVAFDNTYNQPERDRFHTTLKYFRTDSFLRDKMLDAATRSALDHAWNDLLSSFEYHEIFIKFIREKQKLGETGTNPDIQALEKENAAIDQAILAAQPGHVEDLLRFAARAWRRPLTAAEKDNLRRFYTVSRETSKLNHTDATRAVIARILISPAFLYRLEQPSRTTRREAVSGMELANRLSFFIWAAGPDEELRRAATAGELADTKQIAKQARRMLADPKARRMATEFFGQWLGFYRFDQYTGVDKGRFPEFTDELKAAMYEEPVAFFEHLIREDRPVKEILHANYTFVNPRLARHYGLKKEMKGGVQKVEATEGFDRGGVLRMGAILTSTSAPLRTSPVKRGDWLLRRILGTPTPPPPPDAGSIPADDKGFGGLTVKAKLQAHMRNAKCAGCHSRIDPMGFPFESFDPIGRQRVSYSDGKPVEDSAVTVDKQEIAGVSGLMQYLDRQQPLVLKNMSHKLIGYALGRTVIAADLPLVNQMAQMGGDARYSDFVVAVATSPQFRNRRGQDGAVLAKDTKR